MTADITQAEEAAIKLLQTELDESMQKFQVKIADLFGEYTKAHDLRSPRAPREKKPDAPKPNP